MEPFGLKSLVLGTSVATFIAARGIRRKSLSKSGAITAWIVGFLSIGCGMRGFVLLMFYQIGTVATKYKKHVKHKLDADAQTSSVRGPIQVLACSVLAVSCSLGHVYFYGKETSIDFDKAAGESSLACAILAHHSTCLGDTLASELGILSKSAPFLVSSPWRIVPPGTNGGITFVGTIWSAVGGLLMGLGFILMDLISGLEVRPLKIIVFSTSCGVLGSFVDSVLGANFQITLYDSQNKIIHGGEKGSPPTAAYVCGRDLLSNAQVNFVSVIIVTAFGGFLLGQNIF